mmetsp:Transcript_57149/g.112814  ORF Transcript_57149/g.112814 Transcript_57149/m.112814 type:complete len:180 (+) Transcript_57149:127-666(+)
MMVSCGRVASFARLANGRCFAVSVAPDPTSVPSKSTSSPPVESPAPKKPGVSARELLAQATGGTAVGGGESQSDSMHSSDIAFKPTDGGWGYSPKFANRWDDIFAKPPKETTATSPDTQKKTAFSKASSLDEIFQKKPPTPSLVLTDILNSQGLGLLRSDPKAFDELISRTRDSGGHMK